MPIAAPPASTGKLPSRNRRSAGLVGRPSRYLDRADEAHGHRDHACIVPCRNDHCARRFRLLDVGCELGGSSRSLVPDLDGVLRIDAHAIGDMRRAGSRSLWTRMPRARRWRRSSRTRCRGPRMRTRVTTRSISTSRWRWLPQRPEASRDTAGSVDLVETGSNSRRTKTSARQRDHSRIPVGRCVARWAAYPWACPGSTMGRMKRHSAAGARNGPSRPLAILSITSRQNIPRNSTPSRAPISSDVRICFGAPCRSAGSII